MMGEFVTLIRAAHGLAATGGHVTPSRAG
jgi:hypothetical protein